MILSNAYLYHSLQSMVRASGTERERRGEPSHPCNQFRLTSSRTLSTCQGARAAYRLPADSTRGEPVCLVSGR